MFAFAVLLGAIAYAVLHELIEWRLRIRTKQDSCYHDFYEVTDRFNQVTKICRKCNFQTW